MCDFLVKPKEEKYIAEAKNMVLIFLILTCQGCLTYHIAAVHMSPSDLRSTPIALVKSSSLNYFLYKAALLYEIKRELCTFIFIRRLFRI
jgi:hypothetical protein